MATPESLPGKETVHDEIERKFIISAIPEFYDLADFESKPIIQGYFASTPEFATRIRRMGDDEFFWTRKEAPTDHYAKRPEENIIISEEQFEEMWPDTEGMRLQKTRYKIPYKLPHGNYIIELDLFEGENAGHMLAEVEFKSTAEADLFEPPDWFGAEVSKDKRYGNSSIAEHGFPE